MRAHLAQASVWLLACALAGASVVMPPHGGWYWIFDAVMTAYSVGCLTVAARKLRGLGSP